MPARLRVASSCSKQTHREYTFLKVFEEEFASFFDASNFCIHRLP